MTTTGKKTKALCVATRCTNVDQFVATYHRFCDESSFFVATLNSRPVGLDTAFSIQLADQTPVLRGLCTVVDAWTTAENPFKRPGIRLGIKRLTPDSVEVFARLKAARFDTPPRAHTDTTPMPASSPLDASLPLVRTAPVPPTPTPRAPGITLAPVGSAPPAETSSASATSAAAAAAGATSAAASS
ncbi:MAG: hypothetical protein ACTHU0_06125, partial [Kofleriaceae bacterium]